MVLVDAGVRNDAHARLPRPRPHPSLRLCQGHVRPGPREARREGQAGDGAPEHQPVRGRRTTRTRPPTSSCPTRATGGTGTAARSRPTPSTSSCWRGPTPRASSRRGWSSTSSTTASTAAYWNSTRDTAFCIEALADYLKASGEDQPDMTVTIALDGQTRKEVKITPADLFSFDNALVLEGKRRRRPASTPSRSSEAGQGPALLQRLPDQLHARRSDHPRRAGDQGRPQGLPPDPRRQDGRRGRRPRPDRRPARREATAASCSPTGRRSRVASWSRSSWRSTARTTTSTCLRGLQGGRLRAGRGPQRLQRQRPGRLRRVPRRARGVLRPHAGPRQAQRLVPPARRDPRRASTPCPPGPRPCTRRS